MAAPRFLAERRPWWLLALLAVVGIQLFIIAYWHQAKLATFINIFLAVFLIFCYGRWQTDLLTHKAIKSLQALSQTIAVRNPPDREEALPAVVCTWLNRSLSRDKHFSRWAHLFQKGKMKINPKGSWLPVNAEQWFSIDPPGFVWKAQVGNWWLPFSGLDRFISGRGHMLIKLFSLVPVVNKGGEAIDQGAMVRYLAEIIWFPPAIISKYIQWKPLDEFKVRAIMRYGKHEVSGIFEFNAAGDVSCFEASRFYDRPEGATMETWHIDIDDTSYGEFDDVRIPCKASVTWKLEEGDFTWYQVEVVKAIYHT